MVDSNKIRTGKLDDSDWAKIAGTLGPLSEANMYIDDTAGISVMEIRAKCRKLKLEKRYRTCSNRLFAISTRKWKKKQ